MGAVIEGLGYSVPANVLTNKDMEKLVDTTDAWITERTGIKERRIAPKGTANSQITLGAAQKALSEANTQPMDLDGIIVATVTPDMTFPATACFLQDKLGAGKAFAFDMQAACTGYIYALTVADSLIKAGTVKKILICGSDMLSLLMDFQDRSTCVLFGDGAGAAVLGPGNDNEGIISSRIHSDGSLWELLYAPGGGTVHPICEETIKGRLQYIRMQGNETFKSAVTRLVEVSREVVEASGMEMDDVDLFIPHQANQRILNAVGKRLGLDDDRVYVNLSRYGNTSAASIPIAMAEAHEKGALKKGDIVLLSAFGAGLTWGAALVRF
ncbi:MAG: beta-ketoacyl-ACP synthase III [Deltaproteobacteria bacterium]|nr:beta-ketoacyl-ACP synthase III [Deltaproteobacteria bacterium]